MQSELWEKMLRHETELCIDSKEISCNVNCAVEEMLSSMNFQLAVEEMLHSL